MAFPEKLLKIIATRCAIFSLKFTNKPLAAGFLPDQLGSLSAPADPLAAMGPTSKGRKKWGREREGGMGKGGMGKGGREKERRGWGKGGCAVLKFLKYAVMCKILLKVF